MAQILLTEIIPRFGLPSSLQSDKDPEFMSKVTQQLVQFLQIPWKFHILYRHQSSGKVESMNRKIKETLTKLTLEVIWIELTFANCSPQNTGFAQKAPGAEPL